MQKILFIGEAVTLSHVARPLVLAQSLDPRQYEVHFACDPRYQWVVKGTDFTLHSIHSISGREFMKNLADCKPAFDQKTLERYVEEDIRLIKSVRPDVIVGDFRLSLAVSARVCKVPYINVTNNYWSPEAQVEYSINNVAGLAWMGPKLGKFIFDYTRPIVFRQHARPINRVAAKYGLPSVGGTIPEIYSQADHLLFADIPGMIPMGKLPAHHHYLGAVLWSPAVQLPDWWNALPKGKPVIYVSFGSSGSIKTIPAIVEALRGLPVSVIMATAGRLELADKPANFYLADYLPGVAASGRSDLVITNGGSASSQQALSRGVPVLGITDNMDQDLSMMSIAKAGAGIYLPSRQSNAVSIRAAVEEMLLLPRYRRAAQKLGVQFSQYDAPARFQVFLRETFPPAKPHPVPQAALSEAR